MIQEEDDEDGRHHAENKEGGTGSQAKNGGDDEEWWERETPEDPPGGKEGNARPHQNMGKKSITYSGTATVLLSPETNTLSPMGRPRWSLTVSDDKDDDDEERFFSFGRVSKDSPKKQRVVDKKKGM